MGLLGSGAVAIWHDILPGGRADFYAWHGREHMPERVGIPGFNRGRRFIAIDADLEFFNLYETESPAVLTSEAYRNQLNKPTPWTQSAVLNFRNVSRALCRVVQSTGFGQGGLVATWRYDVDAAAVERHPMALGEILETSVAAESIAAAHLLVADETASVEVNAEERARGARNDVPGWILLVEGWGDASDFAGVCRKFLSADTLRATGATSGPIRCGIYQVQATIDKSDLGS